MFAASAETNPPASPFSMENMLILEGVSLTKEKMNVRLFQYDTVNCNWIQIESHLNKKRYELLLNPTESYQVWFQGSGGYLKILYVDPGQSGRWIANMNINFDQTSLAFAHLYQTCDDDEVSYTSDFIHKNQTDALPAMNCESCDVDDVSALE
jgi:hypothetical protein